jgi:hypothetical protein
MHIFMINILKYLSFIVIKYIFVYQTSYINGFIGIRVH